VSTTDVIIRVRTPSTQARILRNGNSETEKSLFLDFAMEHAGD